MAVCVITAAPSPILAVKPTDPEVKELVAAGLARLEDKSDSRLGAYCVIALAYVKAGRANHRHVKAAVDACRAYAADQEKHDVYSNGLAIIFLCELDAQRFRPQIEYFLGVLSRRQKPHGGWGYDEQGTGDTSQSQYAALALWEAHRNKIRVDSQSVGRLSDWLIRTQDPSGAWGYQGNLAPSSELVGQTGISPCMLAAGLGSTLICADLVGTMSGFDTFSSELPAALQSGDNTTVKLQDVQVDDARLSQTIQLGNRWMDNNYTIDIGRYNNYYLYALERYKSFQEHYDGIAQSEPAWYNEGYEFLKANLKADGWNTGGCGTPVDTAFAVLFLLRSTQQTLRTTLGDGTLTAGRGLPANVANATIRQGQVVVQQAATEVTEMLALIDDAEGEKLESLARDPTSLVVGAVDETSARRLRQLIRAPQPQVRLLAVRSLGRAGNLDFAPSLIYALTDPDPQITLEARNGLRFLSRRFDGFGPPDQFDEQERYEAIDRWKSWYQSLRPTAVFEQ